MFVQLLKDWKGKSAGERIDVAEEFVPLLVEQKVAQPCEDPTPALVARVAEQAATRFDGVITRALGQFADAQSQSRKHAVPAIFGDNPRGGEHDVRKNFGDWLLHVARQDDAYLEKAYGSYRSKAAMAESSGTTGGYVVPPEFYDKLLAIVAEEAIIRPRAFVQPMASAALQFPFLDVTTAPSAGISPFFGGVVMNWTEEAQTRTETEPQFKQMELKAHELSGYAVSSNVLLQDAGFGLERFLMTLFARAIAWYEDYAFLQGNGVGKPQGILSSRPVISVTRNAANSVKFVDVATMLSKLLPSSLNRAMWIIHPYVLAQLVQLADSGGRTVWVPNNGGAQKRVPGTLFGLDVLTTEKVPALGTKGDVMLVDPTMYVIGDRMQIEIAASEHVNFLKRKLSIPWSIDSAPIGAGASGYQRRWRTGEAALAKPDLARPKRASAERVAVTCGRLKDLSGQVGQNHF